MKKYIFTLRAYKYGVYKFTETLEIIATDRNDAKVKARAMECSGIYSLDLTIKADLRTITLLK